MNTKAAFLAALALCLAVPAAAQVRLDDGWRFAFGNASSPEADFGSGTEYFNYLTKAASIHNTGPYSPGFDDSSWEEVSVPHDWAATLPSERQASHSHGYKTVGWKYPGTSVGWYRRLLNFNPVDEDSRFILRFDGVWHNASYWFNGVYLGTEPSGYATREFDITPYIDYNGDNVLCVRVDATLEEGWFYEGAGVYRSVWLIEKGGVHPTEGGIHYYFAGGALYPVVELRNRRGSNANGTVEFRLLEADGKTEYSNRETFFLPAGSTGSVTSHISLQNPHLWDICDPYIYTLEVTVDAFTYFVPVGIREAVFTPDEGFLLNGRKVTLKGVNLHQDHAGTGAAVPEALQLWRIRQLKKLGCNAIRCSHNPADPALLAICDREGMLVIDENRLMGTADEQLRLLENMVRWGRSHPSVILWSIGNEEWGLENDERGIRIVKEMTDYVHWLDPYRQVTAANAGGITLVRGLEVAGFNYIKQNDIDRFHSEHPLTPVVGTEETTGCGTRGWYGPTEATGMPSRNVIADGWQFYAERPWAAGLFYWTGFDYRGEPNPLEYPALGSEFGILDACGFPKDEAWYLKSWWTDEPVLHVAPHWNLPGREGQKVKITVYSNCQEVALSVNGKSLGKKKMPQRGYLEWDAVYRPGKVVATGYNNGRKVLTELVESTGPAACVALSSERIEVPGCRPLYIVTAAIKDAKGRTVPNACPDLALTLSGPGSILGAGNGDPCFDWRGAPVLPAFNGLAQIIVQFDGESGDPLSLSVSSPGLAASQLNLE